MNNKPAFPSIDFADAEFDSFTLSDRENRLTIRLISWDERELTMIFTKPLQFCYKTGDIISKFIEVLDGSEFLTEALSLTYVEKPADGIFKLFQIEDVGGFAFIQVVAESVNVIKGDEIVGFAT